MEESRFHRKSHVGPDKRDSRNVAGTREAPHIELFVPESDTIA